MNVKSKTFAPCILLIGIALHSHVLFAGQGIVEFSKDVLPILKRNCIACHSQSKPKGELNLESPESILKGGETGAAIVKGKSANSLLIKMVTGQADTFMPPKKNKVDAVPLTSAEIAVLKLWIDQGATGSAIVEKSAPIDWKPLPPGLHPIYACAVTSTGQFAACGRAHQIFVYHLPTGSLAARLIAPAAQTTVAESADRDFVLSLAFSPDGETLASGGYRNIKLWNRIGPAPAITLDAAKFQVLAASPDGKRLATGADDGRLILWDAASGAMFKDLAGHSGLVRAVSFSNDNTKLCSGSSDKSVRLWSHTGDLLFKLDAPTEVHSVAWVLAGKAIAVGGADGLIRIWTLPESGAEFAAPKELKGHAGIVAALAQTAEGKQLVSGGADGSVRLWEVEKAAQKTKMDHGAAVSAVAAKSDGKRLLSAGANGQTKQWKSDGSQQFVFKGDRRAQDALIALERTVAFYKDEVTFYKNAVQEAEKQKGVETEALKKATESAKAAEKAKVEKQQAATKAVDAKKEADKQFGEPLAAIRKATEAKEAAKKILDALKTEAKPFSDKVSQAKAAVTKASGSKALADKELAALAPAEKPEKVRDAKAKADAAAAALIQAGAAQAAAEKDGAATLEKLKTADAASNAATKAFNDLAAQHKDAAPKFKAAEKAATDAENAREQAEFAKSVADQQLERTTAVLQKSEQTLSTAKEKIAAFEADQKKTDAALEPAKKASVDSEKPIRAIALSADGNVLATAGDGKTIQTFNTETGKGGEPFSINTEAVQALAMLADGRLVSGGGGKVCIWNTGSTWKLAATLGSGDEKSVIADRVLALEFSPDGKQLVSGGGIPSRSGEVKFWNVADGKLVREIPDAHSDTVFCVSHSRDGARLATCSADKLVKIFDTASGKPLKTLEGHTQHVLSVSWKRDGRMLVSSGADKVGKVWDLLTGEQKKTIDGFKKEVTIARYFDPANEILLASGDGQINSVKEDGGRNRSYKGSSDYVQTAAISADGSVLIAGGNDGVLRAFESSTSKLLKAFDPPGAENKADPAKKP